MSDVSELIRTCRELGFTCNSLSSEDAKKYIEFVLRKFNPQKITGHLAIGGESITVPLEPYEFTYSIYLDDEPVYVFFDPIKGDGGIKF